MAAVAGAQYDIFARLNLPRLPMNEGQVTAVGAIAIGAAVLAALVGAVVGGLAGMRFHRKVDRAGLDPPRTTCSDPNLPSPRGERPVIDWPASHASPTERPTAPSTEGRHERRIPITLVTHPTDGCTRQDTGHLPVPAGGHRHRAADHGRGHRPPPDAGRHPPPRTDGDGSTTDVAKQQAAEVADTAKQAGAQVAGTVKEQAGQVTEEAKNQAKQLLSQAQSELSEQAASTQQRVSEGLHALADELSGMARNSEQDGVATDLARQAADRARPAAGWLADRDPGSLLTRSATFARTKPGTYLAIALGAGVARRPVDPRPDRPRRRTAPEAAPCTPGHRRRPPGSTVAPVRQPAGLNGVDPHPVIDLVRRCPAPMAADSVTTGTLAGRRGCGAMSTPADIGPPPGQIGRRPVAG